MKKLLKFLPLLLIAVIGIAVVCCDDDKDETISPNQLPTQSKEFISQYYPSVSVISTQKDKDEYEVMLSDGTRIEFNKAGEWTDVDAPVGKTIPSGFYPIAIDTYVADNFNGTGINEISKEIQGYDVELLTGTDLLFSYDGEFVGYDRD